MDATKCYLAMFDLWKQRNVFLSAGLPVPIGIEIQIKNIEFYNKYMEGSNEKNNFCDDKDKRSN